MASHLTTITNRVKDRLRMHDGDLDRAAKDSLFRQSVHNLKEFKELWPGVASLEEIAEADKLYDAYKPYCGER